MALRRGKMPFSISDCPINGRTHRPDQGVPRKTRARGRPDASHGGRSLKDLNPRQGITTRSIATDRAARIRSQRPQSPPGDYYSSIVKYSSSIAPPLKDLNPRQGITTLIRCHDKSPYMAALKDLNPRQGITTLVEADIVEADVVPLKDLNPRQGITTESSKPCGMIRQI